LEDSSQMKFEPHGQAKVTLPVLLDLGE
jgi:hypothetical protein